MVIHSLTKYIGGHGDLLGGAVVSNDVEFLRQCRLGTLMHFGSVIAPFTAFLASRGLKTLGVRMRQYNANALKIARWLENNPKIETVRYPMLESNPQPRLGRLPPFQDKRVRDALAGETELERLDRVYALVLDCATAAFETGVRLGLALTAPDRP